MRRPEGFDRARDPVARATRETAAPTPRRTSVVVSPPRPAPIEPDARPASATAAPTRPSPQLPPRRADAPAARRRPTPQREAAATLRAAARARRREERAEVRRFTRRGRRRRVGWLAAAILGVSLVAVCAALVYSPLFALRRIQIVGASRTSAAQVEAAVNGQLGTPLALVDDGTIGHELARFPLIRSYSTEVLPPGTLVIRIIERQPVGALKKGAGFELVDPAGVPISNVTTRPVGAPLIVLTGHRGVDSTAFRAITETLVALPPTLIAKVDSVTATSSADVTLTLVGGAQTVVWGTASDSAEKAQVLTALIGANGNAAGQYDVSAPGSAVYRTTPLAPAG